MNEKAESLAKGIVRTSPMLSDNIGLYLTTEELEWMFEYIGRHYIVDLIYRKHAPTIGELMGRADYLQNLFTGL
jgi:hypothetical protein